MKNKKTELKTKQKIQLIVVRGLALLIAVLLLLSVVLSAFGMGG